MPLPLIPVIIGTASLAAGGYGVKKAVDASNKKKEAEQTEEKASDIIKRAKKSLKHARKVTKNHLEELGNCKLNICAVTLKHFVKLFEQIKSIEFQKSSGMKEVSRFHLDKKDFTQLKNTTKTASDVISGSLSGTVAGGAIAFGAYSVVGTLGSASTGTAIAGLHGAAATNATLAWFGGGAIKAGGLGIAGGCSILGVSVAGAALAVVGSVMDAKAKKRLNVARMNLAKAEELEEEIDVIITACRGVTQQADLLKKVLVYLEAFLFPQLRDLEQVIEKEGKDYQMYSKDAKEIVAATVATVLAVKALLDTPMLAKDGSLTKESNQILKEVCEQQKILL